MILGGISFGIDSSGNYGYKKVGADTVTPFKKKVTPINIILDHYSENSSPWVTATVYIYVPIGYTKLSIPDVSPTGYWYVKYNDNLLFGYCNGTDVDHNAKTININEGGSLVISMNMRYVHSCQMYVTPFLIITLYSFKSSYNHC